MHVFAYLYLFSDLQLQTLQNQQTSEMQWPNAKFYVLKAIRLELQRHNSYKLNLMLLIGDY